MTYSSAPCLDRGADIGHAVFGRAEHYLGTSRHRRTRAVRAGKSIPLITGMFQSSRITSGGEARHCIERFTPIACLTDREFDAFRGCGARPLRITLESSTTRHVFIKPTLPTSVSRRHHGAAPVRVRLRNIALSRRRAPSSWAPARARSRISTGSPVALDDAASCRSSTSRDRARVRDDSGWRFEFEATSSSASTRKA